eukprot:13064942-Alexandrium_andersonii.AAC.1
MFQEQKPLAVAEVDAAVTALSTSPSDTPSHRSARVGLRGNGCAARASFQSEPIERALKCSWPGVLRAAM